ncbi:MAG TPA: autotransporter outer membrane beta-barrel domain-containing protein, partial [Xanthomonadaceae bacterium]|nr:autotransporter outer membrane beta-barrel domain-containing protein [Xanthomonadaceae bacterium]
TPAYHLGSNGLTFGVDYRVNDGLVLGGALGYTHQSTTLVDGQGDLTMHGWNLSGYATRYWKNDWYIDSSITWGDNNFDSRRIIDYALPLPDGSVETVDQLAQASSGGNDLAGSLTFGRDFHNKALAYGFYGKLQYDHETFDSFTEQLDQNLPGSGLGLRVDSRANTSVASVLGAKIDYTESMNWGVMIPHAEVEWQHEFRTDPNTFTAFFADDPTDTPILIQGNEIDADFFRLGVGMSFVFPQGRSAFLLYDRTVGRQGITEYNLTLGFRMEF